MTCASHPPIRRRLPGPSRHLAALLACSALVAPGLALAQVPALPQGGQFVAGQGSITAPSANALTVTQTSARAIIDWRSFNIGQGAAVTFHNANGATLNRVTGGDLSHILGSLNASGSLYLINPQGVVIGSSGVVVTGGRFLASSLDVANDAFMAGGTLLFHGTADNAEIRNLGAISSAGGDVVLISRAIRNDGTITAPRGTAALAAGSELLLRDGPDAQRGLVRVTAAATPGNVTNTGRIEAAQAELRAAGGNIYALAGNTQGLIRATGTETRQGRVWLSAGATASASTTNGGAITNEGRIEARNADGTGGTVSARAGNLTNTGTIAADGTQGGEVRIRAARVTQQGTISARGTTGQGGRIDQRVTTSVTHSATARTTAAGATSGGEVRIEGSTTTSLDIAGSLSVAGASGTGGTLHLLGDGITLTGAQIDASGASGGGVVRIGGGRLGGEGLHQASTLTVDAATSIRAEATQRGQGGDVALWSEHRTDFAGRIDARGGAEGGDGGQAEVSSRGVLGYTGSTDLRAEHGAWGTLLLDPYNITISDGATSNASGFTASGDDSVINATTLQNALATANVTVSTGLAGSAGSQAGNITVIAPLSWTSASTLRLQAAGAVNINAAITAAAGALEVQAGTSANSGATGDITVGRFELISGQWVQNAATLAGLTASDFRLTGGTFLRALGGTGTSGDPWRLADIYGVQGMATRRADHYRLANTIAAAGTSTWNSGAGFRPIGTLTSSFTGSLDGAGNVISSLTINRPESSEVGLFGATGASSTISNIGLQGGAVSGDGNVGGLVGLNYGAITQAYATNTVTGTSVVTGGLVGANHGTITRAYATGAVTNNWGFAYGVGGLVGFNNNTGTITQAYATGAVTMNPMAGIAGGLVGLNAGTITASFWDTQTTGRTNAVGSGSSSGAGGLTTANARSQTGYAGWNFTTDWFQDGDMRPIGRWEAAQAGTDGVRVIRNLNQLQLMAADLGASYRLANSIDATPTASTNAAGIWSAKGFVPVGTDASRFTGSFDGAGNVITGLTINLPMEDFVGLFGATGLGSAISNIGLQGGSIRGQDSVGSLIGGATGTTITQAHATGSVSGNGSVGGLIGLAADNTTIRNAYATGTVSGSGDSVGGLVGAALASEIEHAYATGAVTGNGNNVGGLVGFSLLSQIEHAYATGAVTGSGSYIGGLVGWNEGTITQSYATGNVAGDMTVGGLVGENGPTGTITQAYATGGVSGRMNIGGLSGSNAGAITQAYATGHVTANAEEAGGLVGWNGGSIAQAYATGSVTGSEDNAGGLVGSNNSTITASFWNTQTTGRAAGVGSGVLAGTTGLTTSQMQDINSFRTTYAGWDFDTVWAPPNQVGQNNGAATAFYPELYSLSNVVAAFAPNASRQYGDTNPTTIYRGLRAGDSIGTQATISGAPTTTSNVGTYALTANGTTVTSPGGRTYRIVHVPGTLTVTPRAITVTANARSRQYGDANPTLTYTLARTGGAPGDALVNGDVLTGALATTATTTSHVGDYAITQGDLAASGNYAITFAPGTLSVERATLTVTADNARRRQGQPNPVFTFRTSGLVLGETPAVITGLELLTPATATSAPGTYIITPTGGSAANYDLVLVDGALTVTPPQTEDIIGTSNIPPPSVRLRTTDAEAGPAQIVPDRTALPLATGEARGRATSPTTSAPPQLASDNCGSGAGGAVLSCATGFLARQN